MHHILREKKYYPSLFLLVSTTIFHCRLFLTRFQDLIVQNLLA